MGYTNYWYRVKELDFEQWQLAIIDIRKLIDARSELVAFEPDDPTSPAVADLEMVMFNGIGKAGHEPFYIPRIFSKRHPQTNGQGLWFSFCKTNRKPYDELVTACLCVFKRYFGRDFDIRSDGSWDEEWLHGAMEGTQSGVELVENVLGKHYLDGIRVLSRVEE